MVEPSVKDINVHNNDCISRKQAIEEIENVKRTDNWKATASLILANLPSVQPRKGKWIIYSTFDDCYYAKCNQCHETQVFYYNKPLTNFCPNCGADMRGDDDVPESIT